MTLSLGFAIAELPGWFATADNFCGVEITFDANRQPIYRHCGGYQRRLMTKDELRPWIKLVASWLAKEGDGQEEPGGKDAILFADDP
jgi:hypothetical protein